MGSGNDLVAESHRGSEQGLAKKIGKQAFIGFFGFGWVPEKYPGFRNKLQGQFLDGVPGR